MHSRGTRMNIIHSSNPSTFVSPEKTSKIPSFTAKKDTQDPLYNALLKRRMFLNTSDDDEVDKDDEWQ